MKQTTLVTATVLALTTAIISGFSNFIGKISVTVIKDPIMFTTLKNTIVAMLLLGILFTFRQWRELRSLSRTQWFRLLAIGIIGGSVPFALFFTGLQQTTAINGALIHKTLFLWVAFLAIPFLKEKLSAAQWCGIGLIAVANMFVGGFTGFKFNAGELMIVGATLLWAVENIIAKVALKDMSSVTVSAARMVFGSVILIVFLGIRNHGLAPVHLNFLQWKWTLLASALLSGYVLTWYAALKRAPATYVATLLVPATLITNVLSALFVTHAFPQVQALSALCMVAGIVIFTTNTRRMVGATQQTLPLANNPH